MSDVAEKKGRTKPVNPVPVGERVMVRASEAACLLSLPLRTIYELVASGRLKAKKVGKHVMFSRQELERFARSGDAETISGRGKVA